MLPKNLITLLMVQQGGKGRGSGGLLSSCAHGRQERITGNSIKRGIIDNN